MQKNFHHVMCNDDVVRKFAYPYDQMARILASQKTTTSFPSSKHAEIICHRVSRWLGGKDEEEEEFKENPKTGSFMMVYSYEPNRSRGRFDPA